MSRNRKRKVGLNSMDFVFSSPDEAKRFLEEHNYEIDDENRVFFPGDPIPIAVLRGGGKILTVYDDGSDHRNKLIEELENYPSKK